MKIKCLISTIFVCTVISGCASGLNPEEKVEYHAFKTNGVLIEEKDPDTGFMLGFLPGGGSFYSREPVLGVVNLLLWPASIFWDPVSGRQGSESINYEFTKSVLRKKKDSELTKLEILLTSEQIDPKAYRLSKSKIEEKYQRYQY